MKSPTIATADSLGANIDLKSSRYFFQNVPAGMFMTLGLEIPIDLAREVESSESISLPRGADLVREVESPESISLQRDADLARDAESRESISLRRGAAEIFQRERIS